MSRNVTIQYYLEYGKCDTSDPIDWKEVALDDKAELAYLKAKEQDIPFDEVDELKEILSNAYDAIEEYIIADGIKNEDDYIMECAGLSTVDPDDINDLVADRDAYTLKFFKLSRKSEDFLDEWDANDLDELPTVKNFQQDFEPCSPFDAGWTLHVTMGD